MGIGINAFRKAKKLFPFICDPIKMPLTVKNNPINILRMFRVDSMVTFIAIFGFHFITLLLWCSAYFARDSVDYVCELLHI